MAALMEAWPLFAPIDLFLLLMDDPAKDIKEIVPLFTAPVAPDIQKAAFLKYWSSTAGFRHPLVSVTPGVNSRENVLGVYQWYRVMSPQIDINVNEVSYNAQQNVLLLDIVQTFHIRLSPFSPAPSRLLVRLTLERGEDNLHYIAFQEDFYHPDDFTSLLVPPLAPLVRLCLSLAAVGSNIGARIAQGFGYWRPSDQHKID